MTIQYTTQSGAQIRDDFDNGLGDVIIFANMLKMTKDEFLREVSFAWDETVTVHEDEEAA